MTLGDICGDVGWRDELYEHVREALLCDRRVMEVSLFGSLAGVKSDELIDSPVCQGDVRHPR